MTRRVLDRRTLLRGAGGITIGLPLLDAMLPLAHVRAQAVLAPQRFGVFFSANGVVEYDWVPTGTENDFELSPNLAPLAPHKDDIVVLYGLDALSSYMQDGNPHDLSMAHMLTGALMRGETFGRAGHVLDGTVGGPSVDQALAAAIGGDTRLRSLELGVESTVTDLEPMVTRMSYAGPGDPRDPMDDPRQVFQRLFGESQTSAGEIERLHTARQSVLDVVLQDFDSVNLRVGASDREKLERHATAVREIEQRLGLPMSGENAACQIPEAPPDVAVELVDCTRNMMETQCVTGFPEVGRAQMDLMVLAMACDISRVVSLQWSTAESTTVHSQLGISAEHHEMSHDYANQIANMSAISTWYSEQFAYLLEQLKQVPEGDGSLLDNVLLFWPNELSQAQIHERKRLPYVLAGRAGGQLQTGRFLQYEGEPHNLLLASFMEMFGIPTEVFGEATFPGKLTGLV
jgi:hypothetical protein